jgi:S-adenosylmethionine:tRNA ribosyltransferase-isomerase
MIKLSSYNYHLPEKLIAKEPAEPRDTARLFVYDTQRDKLHFDTFRNIGNYLPEKTLLVMNDTKVVPARLFLKKETGGKIEVLLFINEHRQGDETVKGVVDRKIEVGAKLYFTSGDHLKITAQDEQFFFFRPSVSIPELFILLDKEGVTPIPPYIKGSALDESELRSKYQSVFAKHPASVAAPTASLHFTSELMAGLEKRAVGTAFVTLHVGAGTFAPITKENFTTKKLFTEYYDVSPESATRINRAIDEGCTIIPVGTTACRTIETCGVSSHVKPEAGPTNIFIFPPYHFNIAGGLITNFHIPQSSLMLLVDALLKDKGAKRNILDLYAIAIEEKFRFYSFGDGMLII